MGPLVGLEPFYEEEGTQTRLCPSAGTRGDGGRRPARKTGSSDPGSAGILILGSHPPELRNKRLLSAPPGQWGLATRAVAGGSGCERSHSSGRKLTVSRFPLESWKLERPRTRAKQELLGVHGEAGRPWTSSQQDPSWSLMRRLEISPGSRKEQQ